MFRRPAVRYGATPEPETPYQLARQIWDDRIGSSREQAKNWRLACFTALLLCGAMAAGWYWQSARGTVVPWVVQIDKLGNVEASGPATSNYHPTDPVIARDLADVITALRSVTEDKVQMGAQWKRAYKFFDAKGQLVFNDYAQRNDPFKRAGDEQVSVEVTSVVRASDQSFRIAWIERHFTDGALSATEHWSAIATVVIDPPPKPDGDTLNVNPLGIYIDALNWSKELN